MKRIAVTWLLLIIGVAAGCKSGPGSGEFGNGTWEISRGVFPRDIVAWVSVDGLVETWLVQADENFPLVAGYRAERKLPTPENPNNLCAKYCDDVDDAGTPSLYSVAITWSPCTDEYCEFDVNAAITRCRKPVSDETYAYAATSPVEELESGSFQVQEIWALKDPEGPTNPPPFPFDFPFALEPMDLIQDVPIRALYFGDLGDLPKVLNVTATWSTPVLCPACPPRR